MPDIEQDLAAKLMKRFGDRFKTPDRGVGLPWINDQTRRTLACDLNLEPFSGDGLPTGPWYPAFMIAMNMAQEEFAFLHSNAEIFMNTTADWVTRNYKNNVDLANCASSGIALVLKAFHLQTGESFIKRLKSLDGGTLITQYSLVGRMEERRSIILQARSTSKIPPDQNNLDYLVDKLSVYSPDMLSTQDGANAAYTVLSNIWSGRR